MSWRTVVISSNAKLDYQMGYMVVRKTDTVKIHLSEIELLIIESTAVSLTASLLSELTKKKIKVVFCDEKRNPSSELIGYYGSHDTSAKIRSQITWKEEVQKQYGRRLSQRRFVSRQSIWHIGSVQKHICCMIILMKLSLMTQQTEKDMQQRYISMHYLEWSLQGLPKTV